ncbi:hypothetical protein FRC06_008003 [Ceratobasidium sp. 370]|nr:hypothetical protein FRC06_008003 [Ceratobasidium sp. 370]
MVAAFVVALVPVLKALFIVPPANSCIYIRPAPDVLPPLNIIMDTATIIGGQRPAPLGLFRKRSGQAATYIQNIRKVLHKLMYAPT